MHPKSKHFPPNTTFNTTFIFYWQRTRAFVFYKILFFNPFLNTTSAKTSVNTVQLVKFLKNHHVEPQISLYVIHLESLLPEPATAMCQLPPPPGKTMLGPRANFPTQHCPLWEGGGVASNQPVLPVPSPKQQKMMENSSVHRVLSLVVSL